jgi:hypothetical protein
MPMFEYICIVEAIYVLVNLNKAIAKEYKFCLQITRE